MAVEGGVEADCNARWKLLKKLNETGTGLDSPQTQNRHRRISPNCVIALELKQIKLKPQLCIESLH